MSCSPAGCLSPTSAESQNIPGWLEAPAQALRYPFDTYIGGHLTRLGTRDDVIIQQEYVAELQGAGRQRDRDLQPGQRLPVRRSDEPVGHLPRPTWTASPAQAASAVIPNWVDRLGGADVYTLPNAYQLVESLRIDYGQLGPFGIHP